VRDWTNLLRIGMGVQILLVALISTAHLASSPASSQSSSCQVSPSSDWDLTEDPDDYLSVGSPGSGFDDLFLQEISEGNPSLKALDKDLSTEWSDGAWSGFQGIQVENKSATSIMMILEPGKKYTFCIDFSSKGDVYLLTDSNYGMYTMDYMCGEDVWNPICDPEQMESIPMEWRDLATWITYRDSHAYESVTYEEFSVAIDSSGTAWSFAGFGGSNEQVFYLVLDGWNNSRPGDQMPSGDMSVEVLVDVEMRQTLPKITAYMLVGSLPLSCIIIPLILHWKYHSSALGGGTGEMVEVPYLNDG
tara:strand:+ start:3792 stop:4703 length:912 start_codon:yes stop_codon:yes gene_type:complete